MWKIKQFMLKKFFVRSIYDETQDFDRIWQMIKNCIFKCVELNECFELKKICRFQTHRRLFFANENFIIVFNKTNFRHSIDEMKLFAKNANKMHANIYIFLVRYAWFFDCFKSKKNSQFILKIIFIILCEFMNWIIISKFIKIKFVIWKKMIVSNWFNYITMKNSLSKSNYFVEFKRFAFIDEQFKKFDSFIDNVFDNFLFVVIYRMYFFFFIRLTNTSSFVYKKAHFSQKWNVAKKSLLKKFDWEKRAVW